MGYYAPSNSVTQYELYFQGGDNSVNISNVAGDVSLGDITLPATILGTPRAVYLDVILRSDDATAHFWNNAGATLVKVSSGGTDITSMTVRLTDFERHVATVGNKETILYGQTDISAIVTAGATLTTTIMQAKCSAATVFYGLIIRLRVIT